MLTSWFRTPLYESGYESSLSSRTFLIILFGYSTHYMDRFSSWRAPDGQSFVWYTVHCLLLFYIYDVVSYLSEMHFHYFHACFSYRLLKVNKASDKFMKKSYINSIWNNILKIGCIMCMLLKNFRLDRLL